MVSPEPKFSSGSEVKTIPFVLIPCESAGGRADRGVPATWQQSKEVIRIRMEAYDHAILDQSALEIVDTAKRTH